MSIARLRHAVACVCLLLSPALCAQEDVGAATERAVARAPATTVLADILSGQARIGFNPEVGEQVTVRAPEEGVIWLRVRSRAAASGAPAWVLLDRQAIDRVELFLPGDPGTAAARAGLAFPPTERIGDSENFLLAIPADTDPAAALYLRIDGRGFLYLHPQLLTDPQVEQRKKASAGLDRWVNLLLALVALLGVVRGVRQRDSGGFGLALAAILVGLASLATNGQLHRVPGAASLLEIGPRLVPALWLMACGPLLWTTRHFAGLDKHSPFLAVLLRWLGVILAIAGVATLMLPKSALLAMQVVALVALAITALVAILGLLADPRRARWAAIIAWAGVIAALCAQGLVYAEILPPTLLARRGAQPMLALLLVGYLALPWAREIVRERAKLKRAVVAEPTTEEKIAAAREQLMASLETGLQNASEGDMEWIAYRRLLEGLKPVLPQLASAVVAMNYHNEDLLLVEPKEAEPRYRMLLQQRGQLLKNLSRSKAPQQVGLDFDGPDGPLAHVQLAVIPLPIDKPGWGALLIERNATVEYSELELDLAAEFASLATTAGDEAAEAIESRQSGDYDPESGVYRHDVMDRAVRKAHEFAFLQRKPLAVLRIGHDDEVAAFRTLAQLVRDEIDYGESVGRWAPDELLVLAPELAAPAARELGERVLAAARKQGIAVSIGVAAMVATERAPLGMVDRAGQALARVRSAGGNQALLAASSS
ncbi:MAG: 7TM-DISM domain-containing protein [Arenimonas sp.]